MKNRRKSNGLAAVAVACAITLLAPAARGQLTFFVDEGTFNGDTGRYNAAVAAMTNVTNSYNVYGDFGGYNIYVYYNAGIPTAQASYLGSIGFGGTYPNDRVTQHESNHYLGSGTIGEWYNNFQNNVWVGPHLAQLVQQFDGDGAKIYQAGVHFYPYGLNYDSEVVNGSIYMRNIAIMYAMRQDMGIGNQGNPWSATNVTLTASDPVGTSAFNWFGGGYSTDFGGNPYQGWSDKYFAHSGAAYSTGDFIIRTPVDTYNPAGTTPSFTFAGDSLTINNTNGSSGGLLYQGHGTTGMVTINNLILNGGYVQHATNSGDLFQLAGNITLQNAPTIDAANGNIRILSNISGTGSLNTKGNFTTTLAGTNTFTGGTNVNGGTLALENGGATGAIRGALTITGALVKLNATDALGYASGTSVTQITINGGTLDNAVSGNNSANANWTLTGGTMSSSGGGAYNIGFLGPNTITSNASAAQSTISGNVVLRSGNTATISVADGAAATDLLISGAISQGDGPAGITKTGAGLLALGGANTYTGATNVTAGTLAFRTSQSNFGTVTVANNAGLQVGAAGAAATTLTATSLTLGTGGTTSLAFDFNSLNTTAPLISTGIFTANGTVNLSFLNGAVLTAGDHTLIGYTSFAGGGTFPGSPFSLGPRSMGTVTNNGTNALVLNVTGGDRPVWTGLDNTNWQVGSTGSNDNWKLQTAGTPTDYIQTDNVLFDDSAPGGATVNVNIAQAVTPSATNFNNSTKTYNISTGGGFGIGGTGSMVKSGTGTVNLTTANTFTGSVTVNGGTLYANPGNGPNNRAFSYVSAITVNNGGTLRAGPNGLFGWDGTQEKPITVNAGGTLTADGGLTSDVGVGLVTLNGGTLATLAGGATDWGSWRFDDATDKLLVTENSTASAQNVKFGNASAAIEVAAGKTLNFTGTITDVTNGGISYLNKTGAGTLVLSGVNTHSGGTTINAGTVSVGADNNLGAGAVTLNGGGLTTTGGIASSHFFTVGSNGGTFTVTTSGQLYLGAVNMLVGSGPLTVNGNGTLTENTGNLRLGASNTFSGPVTLQNGGILEYGASDAIASGSTVTLANQAELAVQGAAAVSMPNNLVVTGNTNSVLSFENGDAGDFSGPIALNSGSNLTVGLRDWYNYNNSHNATVSGTISGAGNLSVNSGNGAAATLTLTGANPFTGNITVGNATLAAATYNQGDGLGELATNLGNLAVTRSITLNNGGTLSLTGGNVLGTGGSANTLSGLTLVINSGGTFQTGLNGAGSGWWNKMGNIVLNGGAVRVGSGANNSNFQALALIGNVTVGGSSASTIAPLAGSNATTNGIHLGQNADGGQVVTFNVADATGNANPDLTVSARLLNTSLTLTPSGLTKTGAGTMVLAAANAYTGATAVNAGTLLISSSGSIANGPVTIASGAAIGGAGTIGGSLTVNLGAKFVFSLTDTLTVNGASVTFGGFGVSDLTGLTSAAPNGTYTLIDGLATINPANLSNVGAGNAFNLGNGKSAFFQLGSLDLVVVPEPGTFALVVLGIGALLAGWRGRKSRG